MIRLRRTRATVVCSLLGSTLVAGGCARFGSASRFDQAKVDQPAQVAELSPPATFTKRDPATSTAAAGTMAPGNTAADALRRGHREAEAGRFDAAARAYEEVLRGDPANASAHHRLGVIADERGNFAAAETHYRAALRQWPGDADVLNDLGYSYIMQRKYPQAEQTLREVLAIAPKHERGLTNLALLYVRSGDTDRALAVLRLTGSEAAAQTKFAMLAAENATSAPGTTTPGLRDLPQYAAAPPLSSNAANWAAGPAAAADAPSEAARQLLEQMRRARLSEETASASPSRSAMMQPAASAPQPYPSRPSSSQTYPPPAYPPQSYPSQSYPSQSYPTQPYPSQDRELAVGPAQTARPVLAERTAPPADSRDAASPVAASNLPRSAVPTEELPLWGPSAAAAGQSYQRPPIAPSVEPAGYQFPQSAPAAAYGTATGNPSPQFATSAPQFATSAPQFATSAPQFAPPSSQFAPSASQSPGRASALGAEYLPPPRFIGSDPGPSSAAAYPEQAAWGHSGADVFEQDRRRHDDEMARTRALLQAERGLPTGAGSLSPGMAPYYTPAPSGGAW